MNRIGKQIGSLQLKILDEIKKRSKQGSLTLLDRIIFNWLLYTSERLATLVAAPDDTNYDLVFVGQVGVGKTTAMCHLFDMVLTPPLVECRLNSGIRRTKIRELLPTGSGHTTICQITLRQSKRNTFIEVESHGEEREKEFIKQFAKYVWTKAHPAKSNTCIILGFSKNSLRETWPIGLKIAVRHGYIVISYS